MLICLLLDYGTRAEAERQEHSGDGEEQKGVHRADGEMAGGARRRGADRELGAWLLRGRRQPPCVTV